MSAPILVVTGTGTDVGKTVVTAGLGRALTELGVHTIAIKPVESGIAAGGPEDGALLAESTGQAAPLEALTRLEAPLAPPVAAELEGIALDEGAWTRTVLEAAATADLVLVEGAGGLLSPLTWERTLLDLAGTWGAEALIVADHRLGVLSHTRLTLAALENAGVQTRAIVLNDVGGLGNGLSVQAEALRRLVPELPIVELRRLEDPSQAASALAHLAAELSP
jgi:dethiobiotin synthetase